MNIKPKYIIFAVAGVVAYMLLRKQNQMTNASVQTPQYFGGYGDSAVPDWADGAEWKSRLNIGGTKYYV